MRGSGETTRIIDVAIQKLFDIKEINVISCNTKTDGLDKITLVFDHYDTTQAQRVLYKKIKKRLLFEHGKNGHLKFNDSKCRINVTI